MSQPTGAATGTELARTVAGVRAGVAHARSLAAQGALSSVELAGLPELAASLLALVDEAQSLATLAVERLDASGAAAMQGDLSTSSWVARVSGRAAGRSSAEVTRARRLRAYETTRIAWVAGTLSRDAVDALMRGIEKVLTDKSASEKPEWRRVCEEWLLPIAKADGVPGVLSGVETLLMVLDPQAADRRAMDAFDRQLLDVTRVGDQFVLRGALDLVNGAALRTWLDRVRDAAYRDGSLSDVDQPTGDDLTDDARRRMAVPRHNALALAHLIQSQLDGGVVGAAHGVAPHVTLVVTHDDLVSGSAGELHVPGEPGPVLVPGSTVARILCDADVAEVRTAGSVADHRHIGDRRDGRGCAIPWESARLLPRRHHVWDEGRRYRTAPARLRRALNLRDRHCVFPGCRIAAAWCQAHHVLEWEHGGNTDLSNMALVCARHHRFVHEGGWSLTPDPTLDAGHPNYWLLAPPEPVQP